MAGSEAERNSSAANCLPECTLLFDSPSTLENCHRESTIPSSTPVEINKKCSTDCSPELNCDVLSPAEIDDEESVRLTTHSSSMWEIVLGGSTGSNLDSLDTSEAKADKCTSQVPINYNAKTLVGASENLQTVTESEAEHDYCLPECTLLIDSPSTLKNCHWESSILSSTPVEINNGVEAEKCSTNGSPQLNCVALSPGMSLNPVDIDDEDPVKCLTSHSSLMSEIVSRGSTMVNLDSLYTTEAKADKCTPEVPINYNAKTLVGALENESEAGRESSALNCLPECTLLIDSPAASENCQRETSLLSSTLVELNGVETEKRPTNCAPHFNCVVSPGMISNPDINGRESVKCLITQSSSTSEIDLRGSMRMNLDSSDASEAKADECTPQVPIKYDAKTLVEALENLQTMVESEAGRDSSAANLLPECTLLIDSPSTLNNYGRESPIWSSTQVEINNGVESEKCSTEVVPQLSFSTAVVVGTLDCQQSMENKALSERGVRRSPRLSPVTSQVESAGRNKRGRLLENCLRRSPRLSPIPSCPQIEGPALSGKRLQGERTTDGPKLKRFKSSAEESNVKVVDNKLRKSGWFSSSSAIVQHGNGNCEELALSAPSPVEMERYDLILSEKSLRSCESRDKCLGSTKLQFAAIGNEINENKSTLNELHVSGHKAPKIRSKTRASSNKKRKKLKRSSFFIGEPVPEDEAQERWHWRYELKGQRRKGQSWILNAGEEDEVHLNVQCHYLQANVDGCIFSLGDCAHIKGDGKQEHVGRILEFFKTSDDENCFRVQWFFRAEDTVMKQAAALHEKKRLFSSTLKNDNLLECILSKVKVIEIAPALGLPSSSIRPSEYYCDMEYSVKYSTFRTLVTATDSGLDTNSVAQITSPLDLSGCEQSKAELALLDLYAGCGGMSTGLCLGAKLSGVKLVTRWAIDYHKSACDSLKENHPETQVRHTTAEDFLELLKEWEKLCQSYVFNDPDRTFETSSDGTKESRISEYSPSDAEDAPGEFEVSSLVDICYGDPSGTGQHGLKFKVRWKGYDPSEDTWELIEGLSDCQDHIRDFVRSGYESKILPLPGEVDVICGGPPCQGISGYNRFRNTDDPLTDERNQQIVVFFDIVKFLRPKYVLMENVADILRFDKASLGRYALSRLVHMNYQARIGIMAAGSYGLPQFRLRVFLWGALPSERLPQFPLPTHEVIVRYFPPAEFEQNTVAYDEGQPRELEEAIVLRDAISDLPAVTTHEDREEMTYDMPPQTEFQKYIRSTKEEMTGSALKGATDWRSSVLTDHRSYKLSEDDYERLCRVPRRKGANFRDFPGVVVGADNVVRRDPKMEPVLLPSGKPLIPDYVFTFEKGKSKRPFARVWWDENVATVVTFPNLHNQAAIHPEQDRVLTLREYARLQGFPDYYRFCGSIKERYCQVGNAVAVSVSKTLGYALGMAFRKLSGHEALMTLPPKFAFQVPPNVEL